MAEEKTGLYNLDEADRATVLAALRLYQRLGCGDPVNRSDDIHEIATNGGLLAASLDDAGIDELCESLSHTGLSFGDVVNLLGENDTDPYVAAARQHCLLDEGTLEVDLPTIVSRGEDGAYVMAWIFVGDGPGDGE